MLVQGFYSTTGYRLIDEAVLYKISFPLEFEWSTNDRVGLTLQEKQVVNIFVTLSTRLS